MSEPKSQNNNATARAITACLSSPNVWDTNGEEANLVDVTDRLARNVGRIAKAIFPIEDGLGTDATGAEVGSLTEAMMGIGGGLFAIAEAIDNLAIAVRDAG